MEVSAQIQPPDIPTDEEVQVQLMIARDCRIMMHHHLDTTIPDGEIQDNAGQPDHGAPTVEIMRKLQEELQTRTQRSWSLNLEDKANLKRAGLLGPQLKITPSLESARVLTKVFHTDLYRPYRAVRTGPLGYRYADRPLLGGTAKIDCRRSIEGEIDRQWSIEGEKGKKKKRKRRKKKEERRGE
ncbi:hypothetical protein B296_00042663 [Ensete ventricosum]|uniref:Uncharacterized protein n=1 Tax=Ensete ventricosum TaxID=4639 RepID=A0A426WXM6_ENSVE|nr:hypothetical protein B296_00042663 [Ensete ventricosum]